MDITQIIIVLVILGIAFWIYQTYMALAVAEEASAVAAPRLVKDAMQESAPSVMPGAISTSIAFKGDDVIVTMAIEAPASGWGDILRLDLWVCESAGQKYMLGTIWDYAADFVSGEPIIFKAFLPRPVITDQWCFMAVAESRSAGRSQPITTPPLNIWRKNFTPEDVARIFNVPLNKIGPVTQRKIS